MGFMRYRAALEISWQLISNVRKTSNYISHVCDTVIKKTHSTEQNASSIVIDWQVVLCVTNNYVTDMTNMSQIRQI